MRTGRLDVDEYSDRSARITTAKTRGELIALFTDLPDPRPAVVRDHLPLPSADGPPNRSLGTWLSASAVPIAAVLAIVLFFTITKVWLVFLLPAVVALVVGAAGGGQDRWRPGRD